MQGNEITSPRLLHVPVSRYRAQKEDKKPMLLRVPTAIGNQHMKRQSTRPKDEVRLLKVSLPDYDSRRESKRAIVMQKQSRQVQTKDRSEDLEGLLLQDSTFVIQSEVRDVAVQYELKDVDMMKSLDRQTMKERRVSPLIIQSVHSSPRMSMDDPPIRDQPSSQQQKKEKGGSIQNSEIHKTLYQTAEIASWHATPHVENRPVMDMAQLESVSVAPYEPRGVHTTGQSFVEDATNSAEIGNGRDVNTCADGNHNDADVRSSTQSVHAIKECAAEEREIPSIHEHQIKTEPDWPSPRMSNTPRKLRVDPNILKHMSDTTRAQYLKHMKERWNVNIELGSLRDGLSTSSVRTSSSSSMQWSSTMSSSSSSSLSSESDALKVKPPHIARSQLYEHEIRLKLHKMLAERGLAPDQNDANGDGDSQGAMDVIGLSMDEIYQLRVEKNRVQRMETKKKLQTADVLLTQFSQLNDEFHGVIRTVDALLTRTNGTNPMN